MKDLKLTLHPCKNCNKRKVLKSGDYCRECASKWEVTSDKYVVVKPDTIEELVKKTGWDRNYLQERMEGAFVSDCTYVAFSIKNNWHDISVSNMYYLPRVMQTVLERMADE